MASAEPLMSSVELWPINFAPRGWAYCSGQLLPIAQNSALFSLIGTTYGGDGRTTFGLPDMQGRVPIGAGNGAGLSPYVLGQRGGSEIQTLTVAQMPIHNHTAKGTVTPLAGTGKISLGNDPTSNYMGATPATNIYTSANNAAMGSSPVTVTVDNNGGSQPISIIRHYICLSYIIALVGIFPSRN